MTDRPRISDEELRRLASDDLPDGADDLAATLTMQLRAKSGYHCDETHQISARTWGKIVRLASGATDHTPDLAAEVLALRAELSALRTREAGWQTERDQLRNAGKYLLAVCERNGLADNIMAELFPDHRDRKGQSVSEGVKDARRAMNEMRAALSQPTGEVSA